MNNLKYKLRCRKCGILVSENSELHDVIWKRKCDSSIYPMDMEPIDKQKNEFKYFGYL